MSEPESEVPVPQLPLPVAEAVPGPRPALDDDALLGIQRLMVRIRRLEEAVVEAFADGLIPGSTHPCIGQEAIKAGAFAAIRPGDQVLGTYRGHGEALAKGISMPSIMAELMTRTTGLCGGKGGTLHLSEPSVGLVATNGIVAGHIPMSGGVALAAQLRGGDDVVLCFFGDGASCEGELFETLNMAMLWRIPLLFMCENNGFAISVPTAKSQATPDIADRARGFGMPAAIVDGNDPLAVRAAVAEGAERARAGAGPTFIECKTVRWERHSAFSAGGTDAAAQREAWQRVDPIPRFAAALQAWGVASEAELAAIDEAAIAEAAEARAEAEQAPFPTLESVHDNIFAPVPGA
jgi:TPP-dependent pyruvate/acetoin dehydrogenase alpha subunit